MSIYPVQEFLQNTVIFSEGSEGDVAYILKKGCVSITVSAGEKKTELAKICPPAVFGEMALILKKHKRTATATALEYCEVVVISRNAFNDYVDRSPSVISSILKALADRLLTTTIRALRTPDLFMGACEILSLLGKTGKGYFPYDETIQSLTKAFHVDTRQIEGFIDMMISANLVGFKEAPDGIKRICITEEDDFLERADKIYNGLKNMA